MNRWKPLLGILFTLVFFIAQVGGVSAAPASQEATPISGTVRTITLDSDPTTGVVTIIVSLMDADQLSQTIRVSQGTATALGLVLLNEDGNPVINKASLGKAIDIDPMLMIPDQEKKQHPVGSALAAFFSDIEGMDYDTIMSAHENGAGFGVIAQALWLTDELGGDSQLFQDLLYAKEHNDYSAFKDFTEDGTPPKNWGQLRKALINKKNLGLVMSHHSNNGNHENSNDNSQSPNKDPEKDKSNNGHGNGSANKGSGNGNGHTK
jgi:hypothetical protein